MMRVKAKRLGWDEQLTPEQQLDHDPYEHAGDDDLEDELSTIDVPESEFIPAFRVYRVDGKEADPKTIRIIE